MSVGKDQKLDVKALMLEIRKRVRDDIENNRDKQKPLRTFEADSNNQASRKAGELLHSQDLLYLNRNYQFSYRSNAVALTSKLPGIFGKIVIKLKQKIINLREFFLRDYLAAEREFQANLVRFLNDVSKYVDARDASTFWELIRKIDYDVTKALERIERINDEQMASIHSSERRVYDELNRSLGDLRSAITELQGARARNDVKLNEVNSVTHGLESIIARLKPAEAKSAIAHSVNQSSEPLAVDTDYSYLLLENRYRGSEEEISKRLGIYPAYFKNVKNPVLEIGGGRGELQSLFKEQGIKSYCVDTDKAMVDASTAKGFDVRLEDGITHLSKCSDRSIGGVIAVQVVEHLTRSQLEDLFKLCTTKVETGGRVIFETINPQSLLALSSNYFRDLTHVWPLHPDTLSYVMELAGLKVLEVKLLSEVPKEAQLKPVAVDEYMTPRWAYTVQTINQNLEQLNRLLYGHQDYCIVAEVR